MARVDYTNARKQAISDAKVMEEKAVAVSIRSVLHNVAVKLPAIVARTTEPIANVHYSVPIVRMKRLAKEFGRMNLPYRDVGVKSFDYAYEELVGED